MIIWNTIDNDGLPAAGRGKHYLLQLCNDGLIDGRKYTVARVGNGRFYDEATGKSISKARVKAYTRIRCYSKADDENIRQALNALLAAVNE